TYLNDKQIHPVIKTSIFHWLQDLNYAQVVKIHKFNEELDVIPINIQSIKYHPIFKQTMFIFSDLEQQNPSLYTMLEQLLYRYTYVRYPFFPPKDSILVIAQALRQLGEKYINLHKEIDRPDQAREVAYDK